MNTKTTLLEPIAVDMKVDLTAAVDPKEFFQDRDGLYVWSDFKQRIIEKTTGPALAGSSYSIDSFKLLERADDAQIEAALPEKHVFSEDAVCAIVAELITKQPKGEEGTLLNNGYANLFYTPSFVVRVRWRSDGSRWHVCAWDRDGHRWDSDERVFSPATVA